MEEWPFFCSFRFVCWIRTQIGKTEKNPSVLRRIRPNMERIRPTREESDQIGKESVRPANNSVQPRVKIDQR
ncbi:hypothetical protein CVN76_03820 [Bacillus sp. mrc49]|nr:hypothetical protein CVN76_03820 [Bacillus sp. mrc49]